MRNFGRFLVVGALALGGFAGSASANHGEKGEGHAHKKLQMTDLPQAVSSTFQAEANGGQIEELRSEKRAGKTIYEGEVVKNGKGTDLRVGEDGTVLERGTPHEEANEPEHAK